MINDNQFGNLTLFFTVCLLRIYKNTHSGFCYLKLREKNDISRIKIDLKHSIVKLVSVLVFSKELNYFFKRNISFIYFLLFIITIVGN